jgi:hypothetical protein
MFFKSIRRFCSKVAPPQEYPTPMKLAHWGMVVGIFGTIAFVKKA